MKPILNQEFTHQEIVQKSKSQSSEIFKKIGELSKKIENAENQAISAKNTSGGFLGFNKTKRQAQATSEALIRTNEAVSEMNALIQESIKFTCSSLVLSKCMFDNMSEMTKNGFVDRDGKLSKLNKKGEEFANHLITQAKSYIKQQQKLEAAHKFSKENAIKIEEQKATDIRHDKELAAQAEADERHDRELDSQAKTDKRHDREIEVLVNSDRKKDLEIKLLADTSTKQDLIIRDLLATNKQLISRVDSLEALIKVNAIEISKIKEPLKHNKLFKIIYILIGVSLAIALYSIYLSSSN